MLGARGSAAEGLVEERKGGREEENRNRLT